MIVSQSSAFTIFHAFHNNNNGALDVVVKSTTSTPTTATSNRHSTLLGSSASNYLENLSNKQSRSNEPVASQVSSQITASPADPPPAKEEGTRSTTTRALFQHIPVLSLEQADTIVNKVIGCCKRNGFNAVTVYVLDASGCTLVSKRMDACSPVGIPDFAKAKAFSCIVNKYPSRSFRDRYTSNDVTTTNDSAAKFCQMTSMVAISQGSMAPFPGGILIKLGDEEILGAVGVSGAAGDEDEYCAIRGVLEANLGLTTMPEEHSCSTVKDQY